MKTLTNMHPYNSNEILDGIIKDVITELSAIMVFRGDLSDLGNAIGRAVSSHTCKDGQDLNLFGFEKEDFLHGFTHGYSLNDGTHDK